MNGTQVATLTKGMKVEAQWMQVNDPPSSLAGNQMKLGVIERNVVGTVTHIRGDSPTDPKEIRVALKPDDGTDEVWVKPEWIKRIVLGEAVSYVETAAKPRPITHTTKLYQVNPALGLLEALSGVSAGKGPSPFVEDMEARGQQELVSQTTKLPKKGSEDPAWAQMGVVFGEDDATDDLFRLVTLPHGWKLEAVDHAMWSELRDEKGRKRGSVFYKAAFYDRRATIHTALRYKVDTEYEVKGSYDGPRREIVLDTATGKTLFAVSDFVAYDTSPQGYAAQDAATAKARAWLDENRPDWKNAAAYWGWD